MHAALGTANLITGYRLSNLEPRAGKLSYSVVPITGRDSSGALFTGVGLQVMNF